jgi:hypothetical protein
MLRSEKQQPALRALNVILVVARSFANDRRSKELVNILDVAEYLPLLFLDKADMTESFKEQLLYLAEKHPEFQQAVYCFDKDSEETSLI